MMLLPRAAGFELEFSGGRQETIRRTLVERGDTVNQETGYYHSNGNQWDLKTDRSCGYEAASPKITTAAELAKAASVGTIISNSGGRVTSQCGFHVHVDASNVTQEDRVNLVRFGQRYEKAFFCLAPERVGNSFCRPIQASQIRSAKQSRVSPREWERYTWLNLAGVNGGSTVEFRLMDGTLDADHIAGTVLFLTHLVDWIVAGGKKVSWGVAKTEENPREMFQTFLGQGGFYGPYDFSRSKKSIKLARQWALSRYCLKFNEETRIKKPTVTMIEGL